MTQVPLCVIVAWIMGIKMDLNFNLLETGSLALSIIAVAFTLQVINIIFISIMQITFLFLGFIIDQVEL